MLDITVFVNAALYSILAGAVIWFGFNLLLDQILGLISDR